MLPLVTEICRPRKICRVCDGKRLVKFLDLGRMPLVNRYLVRADLKRSEHAFPLELMFCRDCSLSQLSVVVDPKVLYSEYDYHSSISMTFQKHCEEMAFSLHRQFRLTKRDLIVEIASNDGCLLSKFKRLGCAVQGIEPARNLAYQARKMGLSTLHAFWGREAAEQVKKERGLAKLILATNVLAHVDDLQEFLSSVASLLKPTGAFIFEVPYMVNFMNRAEFDTAYHEHLSYFLLRPLQRALQAGGLHLADVQEFDIHGGSIRVTARPIAARARPTANVNRLLGWEKELGLLEEKTYLRFASHVSVLRDELIAFLRALKARRRTIAAYGASAKGNVLLNYCGIGKDLLEYVVDDTPAKQGKFYPGNHLPIVNRNHFRKNPPDYLLLLAWNFVDELVKNTDAFKARGGRYIIPIPSLRVI